MEALTMTTLKIRPGAVRVSHGHVDRRSEAIVCLIVDLKTKRAAVAGSEQGDYPGVSLEATEDSLYLAKNVPRDRETVIEFRDFPGWRVFAAEGGKNLIRVVLVTDRTCP